MDATLATTTAPVSAAPMVETNITPEQKQPEQQPEGQKPEEVKPEVEEKKDDKFSSRFAALAKREKALLSRESRLKEMESKFSSAEKQDAEFKSNPIKYLQERYGLTYNDLTQLVLNDNKPTPDMKVKELEDKMSAWEKAKKEEAEKAEKAKTEQIITGYMGQIGEFIEANAAEFELIKAHGEGSELIYNVVDAHLIKTGRMLSIKEAATHVENYLYNEAQKLLTLNKLKPKEPVKEVPTTQKPVSTAKTLTNNDQTEVPTPTDKPLSKEESLKKAAAMIRWT